MYLKYFGTNLKYFLTIMELKNIINLKLNLEHMPKQDISILQDYYHTITNNITDTLWLLAINIYTQKHQAQLLSNNEHYILSKLPQIPARQNGPNKLSQVDSYL